MKKTRDFQVVVIGGGSAGHAAATTAAAAGAATALVESAPVLGGLCILRGCMPSKTLIETADRLREIRQAGRFGIRCGEAEVDLDLLRSRVASLTREFREYREQEMTRGDYRLLRGAARFVSPGSLEVDGHGSLEAAAFIVATGSTPSVPGIEGLSGTPFWTSDDVIRLPFLPRRLAVLGAGAIGMECAHLFEGLGSRVTILARGPSIMKGMDPEVAQELAAAGKERGIEILRNSPVERVGFEDGCFTVRLEGGRRSLEVDALLVATGRSPATGKLGLEQTGLSMQDGRILIDEEAAASVPGFFAAGDCASPAAVVHLAVMQGIVAGQNAVRSLQQSRAAAPAVWKTRPAMKAWFTAPQCVQVGLSQEEAEERGLETVQGRQDLADHGKGMIAGERYGFVKVILDRRSGRILGASGVGPQVVESGHLLEAAIERGLTATEYLEVPNYHPTFVEAWSRAVEKALDQCPAAGSRKPA
jgi:pyruvate/2-oxoglutarate dehydrogenase complex dihydrolipoamide dehydrogenase (E3) component